MLKQFCSLKRNFVPDMFCRLTHNGKFEEMFEILQIEESRKHLRIQRENAELRRRLESWFVFNVFFSCSFKFLVGFLFTVILENEKKECEQENKLNYSCKTQKVGYVPNNNANLFLNLFLPIGLNPKLNSFLQGRIFIF